MHKSRLIAVVGLVVVALVGAPAAQQPGEAPAPGPEHKKLEHFVGKWSGTGELKPGPFGPGGKMTWTESCEWLSGGFFVMCKSEGTGPMGETKGIGIIGYDAAEKVYTYYGADNTGWSDYAKGTVKGKTWTYNSEMNMEGQTIHSRYIIEETSATAQKFSWMMSQDGSTWDTMMTGESKK